MNRVRHSHLVLILLTLIGARAAFPQSTPTTHGLSLPVKDVSAPGSPLTASGNVSFHVVMSATNIDSQCALSVTVLNRSPKPILAYELKLVAMPDYGTGIQRSTHVENFFRNSLLMSGLSDQTERPALSTGTIPVKVGSPPLARTPEATVEIVFVQFADGSKFGKSPWGDGLTAARKALLTQLQSFKQTYADGGGNSLSTSVQSAAGLDYPWIENKFEMLRIKSIIDANGAEAAAVYIENSITAAVQHQAAM